MPVHHGRGTSPPQGGPEMGIRSWLQGHGWDGTQDTPVEQHTRAMQEQVEAFKARWAARPHQDLLPTIETRRRADPVQRDLQPTVRNFTRDIEPRVVADRVQRDLQRTVRAFTRDMQAQRHGWRAQERTHDHDQGWER